MMSSPCTYPVSARQTVVLPLTKLATSAKSERISDAQKKLTYSDKPSSPQALPGIVDSGAHATLNKSTSSRPESSKFDILCLLLSTLEDERRLHCATCACVTVSDVCCNLEGACRRPGSYRLVVRGAEISMRMPESRSRPLVSTDFQTAAYQFRRRVRPAYSCRSTITLRLDSPKQLRRALKSRCALAVVF